MNYYNLTEYEYWQLFLKNKFQILIATLLGLGLAFCAYTLIPKKYKVTATISLQSQYFQLPLVSGFMPETLDPAELRAKREALISLALNQRFLLELAHRYELTLDPSEIQLNSPELDLLRRRFEIVPTGASGYLVSFTANDSERAYRVLQDFLSHLQLVMLNERHNLLLNLHDAIEDQLEALTNGSLSEGGQTLLATRPEVIKRRMVKLRDQIDSLKNSLSERHPRVEALKLQLAQLTAIRVPAMSETRNAPPADIFAGARVDDSSKELYDDLMKKYRYLEVIIYMDLQNKDHYLSYLSEPFLPATPIFPRLPILLALGLMVGGLLSSARILLKHHRTMMATPPPKLPQLNVNRLTEAIQKL